MAPSVPKKKRKVSLPENEEVAARIFEKHRSMVAQQPGGLPEHQARALSAAYSGVCAAKEPVRTPGDLARLKEEEHTKQTLCATVEVSCLCNNDHTLQGNGKREGIYDEARAY